MSIENNAALPVGPLINVVTEADKLLQIAMNEDNVQQAAPANSEVAPTSEEILPNTTDKQNDTAKTLKQKLELEAKQLKAEAIRLARKNFSGKTILSAEPYNFFQDLNETNECLRVHDLVIQFHTKWNVSSEDIKKFFTDVNIDRSLIEAVGRKPRYKKILLTFSSKGVKREILNIVNSKFSHKYKAWTLEEDETAVTLSEVPHKMTDATLREALGKYGVLDPACTVMHKCDLVFF